MSRAGRWSLILLCVALVIFGLLQPDVRRQLGATTFGTMPFGYGALYETLLALDLPAARSYAAPDDLPAGATVWWIEPEGLCAGAALGPPTADETFGVWQGGAWIAAGGTAVLFPSRDAACAAIFGVTLPARTVPDATAKQPHSSPFVDTAPARSQIVSGPLVARPRTLAAPELATFADAGDMEVIATVDGKPFALARPIGQGRLVVVADARFLRNQWLEGGDDAVLAVDLVRAYGAPRFDERAHGLRRETHPLKYLLRSAALPVLLGLLALGLLFVWRGRLLPPHALAAAPARTPTLEVFVDSLAQLYAGTGDFASVLERYQQLTAARLRRHFGLPPETPLATLIDRLRAGRRAAAADLDRLSRPARPASRRDLVDAVQALDRLVHEVAR